MNETRKARITKHIKENADIYAPLVVTVIAGIGLTLIGIKLNRAMKAETEALTKILADSPEGSRLMIDAITGDYLVFAPVDK